MTLLQPVPTPDPATQRAELSARVDALVKGDSRFGSLQVETLDGVIRLRGQVPRWEDLHDLTSKLSVLPGVERVVLDNIRLLR